MFHIYSDINDVPQFGNLPLTETDRFRIEENSLVGTTLYHVEVRDQDDSIPDVLVSALFSPNTGAPYFSMSSGLLILMQVKLTIYKYADTVIMLFVKC